MTKKNVTGGAGEQKPPEVTLASQVVPTGSCWTAGGEHVGDGVTEQQCSEKAGPGYIWVPGGAE